MPYHGGAEAHRNNKQEHGNNKKNMKNMKEWKTLNEN
jgi:hypothetical protein